LDVAVKKLGIKNDDILSLLPEGLFIIPSTKKLIWDVSNDNYKASIIHLQSALLNDSSVSIKVNIDQKLKYNVKQKNIVAIIPGNCDSILVFSAHYDHLGKMGNEVYFPGASDNASGTSLMLELANYYKKIETNKYTMVFIAFSGEEAGLLGSQYFIDHPLVNLKKIKFLTNIDIAGDATNGITVVNGSVFKNQFDLLNTVNNEANLLPEIRSRGKAPISDHYFFSEKNIPSFFIYTNGGKGYYHDIFDQAKELSLNNIDGLYNLLIQFYNKL
jgi:Zn-dependent M28 family amino/carboxypeptidase